MNSRLRVLRLTPHFYRPGIWPVAFDPIGGLQVQVWNLTEALDRLGIEQTVLTSFIPGGGRVNSPFPRTEVRSVGMRLPRFLAGVALNFTWFLAVLPRLLIGARRFDLVHIHFNHSVWCRALALIAARLGVPVAVSLNTALWGGLQSALRSRGVAFDLPRWVEGAALRSADVVIALTATDAAEKASEMGIERRRFAVVPDSVCVENFASPPAAAAIDAFRARFAIPPRERVVAYIGRISAEKGWQDLPALVETLTKQDGFLLIAGDGPDRVKLERELKKLARPGRWRITGFLTRDEVKLALASTQVLVLPSRREAFGSVLLEAMASDVPAVAYAIGGIPEVAAAPNAIRLVEPGRCDSFAASAVLLLEDTSERRELVARGHARVRHFSLQTAAARMLEIYRGLAAGKAVSGSPEPTARPS